ncbi:DUF1707 and FHA domain-containing protein [Kribbella solani]|uniref:FHA domain-containing protein n=1 Tax=Kribbella solani TaxID=236067 RepID=A0A841DNM8_9ACTN|nr:DUF1707 and FHA domain-containing protein [Kribbella solani]MBB5978585.1 hypothetical protein [Kribbella solani]
MSSVPVGTRPSDAERDRALAVLRDGAGSGRLSHDTFVRRMNFVLNAQSRGELTDAIRDLPHPEPRARIWLRTLRTHVPRLTLDRTPNHPTTALTPPTSYGAPDVPYGGPAVGGGVLQEFDPYAAVAGPVVSREAPPNASRDIQLNGSPGAAWGAASGVSSGSTPGASSGSAPGGSLAAEPVASSASYRPRSAARRFRLPQLQLPRLRLLRAADPAPPPALALPAPGSPTVRIGRGAGATLRMADISVSRFHAELRHSGDGWMVRDLGSMNGTEVNGLRITTPVRVRPGDHISFGAVEYILTWTDQPQ